MSSQNTATPWNFFHAVEDFFGIKFKYDMAASADNAKCDDYCTVGVNSLSIDWPTDGWCWLNPPFRNLTEWIDKCSAESKKGASIVSIWPLGGDLNTIPYWEEADKYIIHGRVWTLVRACVLCQWPIYCPILPPPEKKEIAGLRWDKKTGTLTEIWTR